MKNAEGNITRNRLRSSSMSSIISISLVLFMLGIIGLIIVLNSKEKQAVHDNVAKTLVLNAG